VPIKDVQFRIAVAAGGVALVVAIASLRFCGSLPLPAKPEPPANPIGTSRELLTSSVATPVVYQDYLARDAAAAGVRAPTIEEMARKLVYRIDGERRVLEIGAPALEVAGVRLRALHVAEGLALEVANATGSDLAYHVATTPVPAIGCSAAPALPFNAMTLAAADRETRVECSWRDRIALAVTQVETLELSPLSAWYVSHVPPSIVGIEPRIARAHRAPNSTERCSSALPQAVRSGLERGEIGWRDLVDFYARHRCQTYHFPLRYRAFNSDNERSVPAVAAGM